MQLSMQLNGALPQRKLEALQRWHTQLSDYNRQRGDLRQLLKKFDKQAI